MRILILGGKGQLGMAIVRRLRNRHPTISNPSHDELDITDFREMTHYVKDFNPSVIINCVAIHDAKLCEEDPEKARLVNVTAVEELARIADEVGAKLIHFSTDQVLRASPGVQDETADTFAYDVYSQTKRESELVVSGRYTVVRVSALYGHDPCRGKSRPSFVEQVIQAVDEGRVLELPSNIGCSPGYVEDIAKSLSRMISDMFSLPRIVHLSPQQLSGYSWYRFACDVAQEYKKDASDLIVRKHQPGQSTGLVNMKTQFNWWLPPVRESLKRYMKKRKES